MNASNECLKLKGMVAEKKVFGFPCKVGLRKFQHLIWAFFSLLNFLGACQNIDNKNIDVDQNYKNPTTVILPGITFLDSLSDTLKPQKTWLKETSPPITVRVPRNQFEVIPYQGKPNKTLAFPKIIERPYLKNEKGEAILDAEGNHYFLGESGISHFTSFNTDNGLGLDNITSSLLDTSGNIWFGTWGGGISKFDGLSFVNFTTEHGLSNNLVHCLAEDNKGNIWIGTDGGGISIYDGYSFSNNLDSKWLKNGIVYGIAPDSKGNIWMAAGEGGAYKYDGKGLIKYSKEDGLPSNNIIKIAEDNNGFIWFGTGNRGASRFDGKSFMHFTKEDGLAGNGIYCMAKDKSGNLWFGTKGGGISKYDQGPDLTIKGTFTNFTIADGLGHNDVWDIEEDLQGNMWFATGGGGISKFDGKKFTNYTTAQGLAENVVYSITTDGSGNLWSGTSGGGVSLYMGAAFNNFTADLGLAQNSVYGIVEDNNGNLWFGTDGGGISKYDGRSFTNFTTDQGLPNPLIICAVKDQKGQLWFGTGGGGIVLYKEESDDGKIASFTTFNSKNGLQSDIIYSLKEDRFGNLWIGTGGAGLVKLDYDTEPLGQSGFTTYTTEHGLANNSVYSILEDRKGNLWIGTGGGGVSKFDGKSFTNYSTAQGLSNDIVWSILEDNVGNLWFATQGGGVSRFDGQAFSSFTKREGLVDDTVYDLLEDNQGNIFIGTNRGFTVVPAQVASLPFQEMSGSLEYFNTSNGYPVKDVNKGIFLDSKGNLWAGNGSDKTGLVKFNYQALRKKRKKPSIIIKNIRVYEKPISWLSLQSNSGKNPPADSAKSSAFITDEVRVFGRILSDEERKSQENEFSGIGFSEIRRFENFPEKLVLPYSQNQITLGFGTDELVRSNLMEYRYILEGYTKGWSPEVKSNSATFGNIREGDYVFKVIARYTGPAESEGKEWSEEAVYRFSVLPPWHRTWWAYSMYGIILLVGMKRVHVFQKTKTIRKERDRIQERELKQAKEIEKAYKELKATQALLIQKEKMASLGELTAGIAHEIQNPLNFVNNFSEVSAELVEEIKESRAKEKEARAKKQDPREEKRDESEALEDEIIEDIKQNLARITYHGKRADAIVKGMLEHSRTSSGEKVPTDINALAEEYLKLSYHGMRAKDKSFSADYRTDFDPNLPKVHVVPQDIGRVLLNIINNAFQACAERSRSACVVKDLPGFISEDKENLEGIRPIVTVSTKTLGDKIQISIKDNGPGIPESIKEKIFQPFFTTKPTGQGTGLGLSLSYDIVKAHGEN
jgi:signal transduction histidine kinase/ligand-binding sensor domain-containing protein